MNSHLSDDKILDVSKWKTLQEKKAETSEYRFHHVEHIIGQGGNAGMLAFSHFPTMYSKALFHIISRISDFAVNVSFHESGFVEMEIELTTPRLLAMPCRLGQI